MKKLQNIPFRFRLIIEIILLLAIAGGYYYFKYIPQEERLTSLEEEYDGLIVQINKLRPYELSYDDFKEQLEILQRQFNTVLQVLPNEKSYYLLYDEVVGLAEKDKVKVNMFQPAGEKRVDNFHSSVNFSMNMVTDYQNLVRYLYDLNYLDKIVNVQSFSLINTKTKDGDRGLSVNATLNSYRFDSGGAQ
ncbi:type 4a pilus biogenesis protein PilO [Limisalsivibrio acetivorans]|uniref:type 4a pilus biogenesis protein PilO n=1 Tax=Limisalsivibrio acetivorans TaxID=1304888 RepID=UPI0003B504A1|nr:type 4a pilus biogenesis protein PilO [Limisalsivibrio acetivorans]